MVVGLEVAADEHLGLPALVEVVLHGTDIAMNIDVAYKGTVNASVRSFVM